MDTLVQIGALLLKAYKHSYRSWAGSLLRILLPAVLVFVPWLLTQQLTNVKLSTPSIRNIGDIPRCLPAPNSTCTTILYTNPYRGTAGAFIDTVMQTLCEMNKPPLTFGVDVVETPYTGSMLINYLYTDPNMTLSAIDWDKVTYVTDGISTNFTNIQYNVIYNNTYLARSNIILIPENLYLMNIRMQLVKRVDAAMLRVLKQYQSPNATTNDIVVGLKEYPSLGTNQGNTVAILARVQLLLFFIAFTIPFLYTLSTMMEEKSKGLVGYMTLLGLKASAFWIAAFIEQLFYLIVTILLSMALGYSLPNYLFFKQTDVSIMFLILFSSGLCNTIFAFLLVSMIETPRSANIVAGAIFLMGLASAMLWAILGSLNYQMYQSRFSLLAAMFPPFSMMKMFQDVIYWTGFKPRYSWQYFDSPIYYQMTSTQLGPAAPTTERTVLYLCLEALVLMILAVFLDQVVPSSHKASQRFLYFLTPGYWGFGKSNKSTNSHVTGENSNLVAAGQETALVVENMSKDYRKGIFSSEAISALRPFSLTIPNSTVLCMLGHNGAGKTTAVHCFIGLQDPTNGSATFFGLDIVYDRSEIHKMMGVCPQFDLLWDDLTAMEHLQLINSLKTSEHRNTQQELDEKLAQVRLTKNANDFSATFSGGMKRRLSFTIATVGNPRILFLDEPTTGMDPGNRIYVWEAIKQLREGRLIVLTTHCMEEADFLGDRIGIMANGKLRAEGSAFDLKRSFGAGYRVTINTEPNHIDTIKTEIRKRMPGAQLVSENAGSLVYALPDSEPDSSAAKFFGFLQNATVGDEKLVADWGLHNTTLEDVFVTLTRQILGQDVSYVMETTKQKRSNEERAYNRDRTARFQQMLSALKHENHVLRRLLAEHGIQAPPTAVEDDSDDEVDPSLAHLGAPPNGIAYHEKDDGGKNATTTDISLGDDEYAWHHQQHLPGASSTSSSSDVTPQ